MRPSEEQKIEEREPIKAPVRAVKNRSFVKWDATTRHMESEQLQYKFDRVSFSLAMPNFHTMLDKLKIVLPCTFQFRDAYLRKIRRKNIAPKAWVNNILQRLSFRINGEELVQFPENGLHSRIVWNYATDKQNRMADEGSLLPLIDQIDRNRGFEARQLEFSRGLKEVSSELPADNNQVVLKDELNSGWEYDYDLEIFPDLVAWQAFSRKVMSKAVEAGSFLFEADLELTFRADTESTGDDSDYNSGLERFRLSETNPSVNLTRHDAIWRECFQIGSPMIKAFVESKNRKDTKAVELQVCPEAVLQNAYYIYGKPGAFAINEFNAGIERNFTRGLAEPNHNTIVNANGGQVADDTHTYIEWSMKDTVPPPVNANVDQYIGGPKPGDILVVSQNAATGVFTRNDFLSAAEGSSWVRISQVDPCTEQGNAYAEAVCLTHSPWRAASFGNTGVAVTRRRVCIVPAMIVRRWQHVRRWKLGDQITFQDPGNERVLETQKLIALNDPYKRLMFQYPVIPTSGVPEFYPSALIKENGAVINQYAKYGGMSVMTGNGADTVQVDGVDVPRDINNVGAHATTWSVINPANGTAGDRFQSVRKFVRIDNLPVEHGFEDGDVVRIEQIEEAPMRPDGSRSDSYTGQFVFREGDAYIFRNNHDDTGQTWDEMKQSEDSNCGFAMQVNVEGELTGYTFGSDAYGRAAQDSGNVVFTHRVNENNQLLHVGGRVRVYHHDQSPQLELPVAHITAKYRKQPYVEAIAIEMDEQFMKQKYEYPYMENEIYRQSDTFDYPTKKSFVVRMNQITLLQGFSNIFIYAPMASTGRRLEFYTAFGDMYFDISEIKVRINEKQCIRGDEPETWFYDEFCKISEKKYTFEQWKQRKVIALTPESLQFPGLFEGAKRLYNVSIEFVCKLSQDQELICKQAQTTFSTLGVSKQHAKNQQFLASQEAQDFVKKLKAEARVVVEYTRKKVSLEASGDVKIDHQLIPTQQPDGLTLRGKTEQSVVRSGGNPLAYLQTF